MSFGTLAGQVVFAFIFIFALVILVAVLTQGSDAIDDAQRIRAQMQNEQLRTNLDLSAQHSSNTLTLNITNTGSTTLNPEHLDVYVNNDKIDRNDSQVLWIYTIDTANPRLLDPGDKFTYSLRLPISSGTHRVLVTTPTGTFAANSFEAE